MSTKIEWTDEAWNPVTGCAPVSEGCANCYAKRMARRLAGRHGYPPAPRHFNVTLHPNRLEQPLRWHKPRRVFVCSMSDLFHEDVPFDYRLSIFSIMACCPHHIFQILTKRAREMYEFLTYPAVRKVFFPVKGSLRAQQHGAHQLPLPNVWFGVTVENQAAADERIPVLLQIPAAMRFVSYEPALEAIDLQYWLDYDPTVGARPGIDFVIAGCESGPKRRPAKVDWFRSIRDQCIEAGIPFFLKQMEVDGKVVSMPELDGKVWKEWPK